MAALFFTPPIFHANTNETACIVGLLFNHTSSCNMDVTYLGNLRRGEVESSIAGLGYTEHVSLVEPFNRLRCKKSYHITIFWDLLANRPIRCVGDLLSPISVRTQNDQQEKWFDDRPEGW